MPRTPGTRTTGTRPSGTKAASGAAGPRAAAGDLIRGSTDLLVLSVLADRTLYGYAIIKQVAAKSEGAIRLTPGVLYPLLHEMEKKGLLLSSWEEVRADGNEEEGSGRKRKWYRLAAKGKRRFEQRAKAHRSYLTMLESFLPGTESSP